MGRHRTISARFSTGRPTPRRRTRTAILAVAAVLAPLAVRVASASAVTTSPDALIAWDVIATSVITTSEEPVVTDNSNAMVSAAMYDAVNAVAGAPYEPYLVTPAATGTESVDAAVAAAAFDVLTWLFPQRRAQLQTRYDQFLSAIPDGPDKDGGLRVGREAAAAMTVARTGDGRNDASAAWTRGTAPGQWRPAPPNYADSADWLPDVRTFAIPSGSTFRTSGPPALTSPEYTRDFNEVKSIGGAWSARSAEQNSVARFWATPGADYEIKRQLATSQQLDALETARFFAVTDVARADAHIACYNEKKAWNFWRPVTAIRQAATDGNPNTTANPFWTPMLGATPGFPDYPSGRACHIAGQMVAQRLFFGRDDVPYHATFANITRNYTTFTQAVDEVINARVWEGIHFRSATIAGAGIGTQAAEYVVQHNFRRR
jgi:hypothetical protein